MRRAGGRARRGIGWRRARLAPPVLWLQDLASRAKAPQPAREQELTGAKTGARQPSPRLYGRKMCPRNRDRSLKCGTPRSPKPIVSAVSTPPPCPPSAASTSDLPPLSCPAPTISTPRSRRHRAQKLGRKDQRAGLARSCPSHIFIGDTKRLRSFATSSSTPVFISRSPFSPHSSPLSHLLLPPLQPLSLPEHVPASPSRTCNGSENYVRRGRHVVAPRRVERRG